VPIGPADLPPRPPPSQPLQPFLVCAGFQQARPSHLLKPKVIGPRHGWHGSAPTITAVLVGPRPAPRRKPAPKPSSSWAQGLNEASAAGPGQCRGTSELRHADVDVAARVSDVLMTLVEEGNPRRGGTSASKSTAIRSGFENVPWPGSSASASAGTRASSHWAAQVPSSTLLTRSGIWPCSLSRSWPSQAGNNARSKD